MKIQFIHHRDLPQHIACDFDFSNLWWSESKNNKHYASLKRNKKYIDTTTYNDIACLTFPNCIKFFVKSAYGNNFDGTAFACYDWTTDTLFRFNCHCVSLSIDNELFGRTKQDIINQLFGDVNT